MILGYLIIINIIALYFYGIDKRYARKGRWRIPEITLLGVAFVGGSLGALLGMKIFHHKTQKWKFRIFVPLFLIMHIMIGIMMYIH